MPSRPLPNRAYKTTEAQRSRAAARRAANPEASRAYAREYRAEHRESISVTRRSRWAEFSAQRHAALVGPRIPLRRPDGTTAQDVDRAYYAANRETIVAKERARRRAKGIQPRAAMSQEAAKARKSDLQRLVYAEFREAFVGPLRPRGWRRMVKAPAPPRVPRSPKPSMVCRPPKPTRKAVASPQARPVPPFIFGPPKPSTAFLRAQTRQAKQQAAEAIAQANAEAAQARAVVKAGKAWDLEAYRVFRSYVVALQKLRTKAKALEYQRRYDASMRMTDEEREAARVIREAAQAKQRALDAAYQAELRRKAEERQQAQAAHEVDLVQRRAKAEAEAQAIRALMSAPRRVTRV